jgi:hypothetical protein
MEINEIKVRSLDIPDVPEYLLSPTLSVPNVPPVTTIIGTPIINIPGCVETYESDNKNLIEDDPNGVLTLCDSSFPSFNPIQFEPNQVVPTRPSSVPKIPEAKGNTSLPITPNQISVPQIEIECPTQSQRSREPVGTYVEGYRKKIIEYKLIGNECLQITEEVGITEQIVAGLPSSGQVMSVAGIAVAATTAALVAKPLSEILLKLIKPTIKKIMKKISTIRGVPPKILSVQERRNIQRERNQIIQQLTSIKKIK